MKKTDRWLIGISLVLFILVFGANSILVRGEDYVVFWKAGRDYLNGVPLYDILRDGKICYKYLPWSTVLFLPFSVFDLVPAGILWRFFQLVCILWTIRWCFSRVKVKTSILPPLFALWGAWMYNIVDGQVTPVLMLLALWGHDHLKKDGIQKTLGITALLFALSTKIFHLVAILGTCWRKISVRNLVTAGVILALASMPAILVYPSLSSFVHGYVGNSYSMNEHIGGGHYGLSSLWVLLFGLSLDHHQYHLFGFAFSLLLFMGFLWVAGSRVKNDDKLFALALGLAASIHPLTYSYNFAFVYPLSVFAWDAVLRGKETAQRQVFWLCSVVFGLCCVSFLDRLLLPMLGSHWGGLPVRAIGTWILAITFVMNQPREKEHHVSNLSDPVPCV